MQIGNREVKLTNPDKVFFPEPGLTKDDLVRYYLDLAPHLLHHVRRRWRARAMPWKGGDVPNIRFVV